MSEVELLKQTVDTIKNLMVQCAKNLPAFQRLVNCRLLCVFPEKSFNLNNYT